MSKLLGELLAPAGNLESAIAALENGADAVYAGFSKFNAREMNENFLLQDMSKLSAYCKAHNKRYYNTFNTLIKEEELDEFYHTLNEAITLEPDALIVQDIGVATIIKELFPNQKIHTSTQMGIHNSLGLEWAKNFGFDRVILERQITLNELKTLAKQNLIELEIFIHGALCCSISGNCIFSSWIGGYSGNRGKCKQPCRRRYYDHTKNNKNGFYFSTTDLCMVDTMRDLLELGISSFKIEGRLKRLDYIISTVKAYRKVIDEAFNENLKLPISEAKQILSSAPSRVWSHGFFDEKNHDRVVTPLRMGVAGKLAGTILNVKDGEVKIKASTFLKLGDRIRFISLDSKQTPSITIRKIKNLSRPGASNIKLGEEAIINCDAEVLKEAKAYLVGNALTYSTSSLDRLPEFKKNKKFDLSLQVKNSTIKLLATFNNTIFDKTITDTLEEAKNKNLDMEANLKKIFAQTANDNYKLNNINIEQDKNYFIPTSLAKKIRRDFYQDFFSLLDKNESQNEDKGHHKGNQISLLRTRLIKELETNCCHTNKNCRPTSVVAISPTDYKRAKKNYPNCNYALDIGKASPDFLGKEIFWILPFFLNENNLLALTSKIDKLVTKGEGNFLITSIYQLTIFEKLKQTNAKAFENLSLILVYPLQVNNSISLLKILNFVDKATLWVELSNEEQLEIVNAVPQFLWPKLLQYKEGYPALLSTRATLIESNDIKDDHGLPFKIVKNEFLGLPLFQLFSGKKFLATSNIKNQVGSFYDFRGGDMDNDLTDQFNFNYRWV